mgnify:CR=1 FL=1
MKENESVQYINKTALLNELLYLKEAAKKVNPKETYILMAQERFIKDLDWFIEIVDNYPSPVFSLPRFLNAAVVFDRKNLVTIVESMETEDPYAKIIESI